MTEIEEGHFVYKFDPGWTASQYDTWPYYRDHLTNAFGGLKAVDIIAISPKDEVWLIECKDYRTNARTKPSELADEISAKVRDTLTGLIAAAKWHSEHQNQALARKSLQSHKIRVVLHLELPPTGSPIAPNKAVRANLQQKLQQLVGCVDKHPKIISHQAHDLPWSITAMPRTPTNTETVSRRKSRERRGRS